MKKYFRVFIITALMFLIVSPILTAQNNSPDVPPIYAINVKAGEPSNLVVFGLMFPLDMLEGMRFEFPQDALEEDIILHFSLPDFAAIDDDLNKVLFFANIISAVSFDISVKEEFISPYTFSEPVEVSIPFDVDTLAGLGVTPYDLTMMFVTSEGKFESEGIKDVAVNMDLKVLTSKVDHLSDIAIVPRTIITGVAEDNNPAGFSLDQNFPNPFNMSTTIRFSLPRAGFAELVVYNVMGQKVRSLISEFMTPGSHSIVWDGCDDQDNPVTTGVYFSRLQTRNSSVSSRMMLVK